MLVARTIPHLEDLLPGLGPVALVPTMGALHAGHQALVAEAGKAGPAVASIFVNPRQFGAPADLARYPRTEPADLHALEQAGCALAFLPDDAAIYPPGDATTIDLAGPALGYEGAHRPGHFRGVAGVVARLFGLVRPATAWFGQKDWQQLQVVRRMTQDLRLPVQIRDVPTLRDADGLALSSRNRFLSPAERALAPALARTCRNVAAALHQGMAAAPACAAGRAALEQAGFAVEYLDLVGATTMQPVGAAPGRLIVAARLGTVRLLDNFAV